LTNAAKTEQIISKSYHQTWAFILTGMDIALFKGKSENSYLLSSEKAVFVPQGWPFLFFYFIDEYLSG